MNSGFKMEFSLLRVTGLQFGELPFRPTKLPSLMQQARAAISRREQKLQQNYEELFVLS